MASPHLCVNDPHRLVFDLTSCFLSDPQSLKESSHRTENSEINRRWTDSDPLTRQIIFKRLHPRKLTSLFNLEYFSFHPRIFGFRAACQKLRRSSEKNSNFPRQQNIININTFDCNIVDKCHFTSDFNCSVISTSTVSVSYPTSLK